MAGIKKKDWTKGHEISMEELEKACEEKKGDNNMTKEEFLMKENEELKKKLEVSEKVIDILNKKIECLDERTNLMSEFYEKVVETNLDYTNTLEEAISEFTD